MNSKIKKKENPRISPQFYPSIKTYASTGGSRAPKESCLHDIQNNWTVENSAFKICPINAVIWKCVCGSRPWPKRTTAQEFSSSPFWFSSFSPELKGLLLQACGQTTSAWKRNECRSGQTLESERAPTSKRQIRAKIWEIRITNVLYVLNANVLQ